MLFVAFLLLCASHAKPTAVGTKSHVAGSGIGVASTPTKKPSGSKEAKSDFAEPVLRGLPLALTLAEVVRNPTTL